MQGLIDKFYDALRRQSSEDLQCLITSDFKLSWQGPSAIPWAGDWDGVEGLLEFVGVLARHVRILGVEPQQTLHGPECSVVILRGHWMTPATGCEIHARAANVFTFCHGRIASYTVLNDTARFVDALAVGKPAEEGSA